MNICEMIVYLHMRETTSLDIDIYSYVDPRHVYGDKQ